MQCESKAWDSFVVPRVATRWLQHRRRRHRARSAIYPTTSAKTCTEPGEVSRYAELPHRTFINTRFPQQPEPQDCPSSLTCTGRSAASQTMTFRAHQAV